MSTTGHGRAIDAGLAAALALAMLTAPADARQMVHGPAPVVTPVQLNAPPAANAGEQVTLDRVVAIVNGDLILESDVDAEERFAEFQPFSEPKPASREELIDRLIDRAVILQQMALQDRKSVV